MEGDTRSNTISIQVLCTYSLENNRKFENLYIIEGFDFPEIKSNSLINGKISVAPVCRSKKTGVRGKVDISCEVEANPPPTHFSWSINTSTGLIHIPQVRICFIAIVLNLYNISHVFLVSGTILVVGVVFSAKTFADNR